MATFNTMGKPAVTGTADLTDWITDMPDQNALDAQWDRIADKVHAKVLEIETNPDVMALQNKSLFAQDTGQGSSFAAQFAQVLARLDRIEQALNSKAA